MEALKNYALRARIHEFKIPPIPFTYFELDDGDQRSFEPNGNGMPESRKGGVGLVGVREWVESQGGLFILYGQTGKGLAVAIELPVTASRL